MAQPPWLGGICARTGILGTKSTPLVAGWRQCPKWTCLMCLNGIKYQVQHQPQRRWKWLKLRTLEGLKRRTALWAWQARSWTSWLGQVDPTTRTSRPNVGSKFCMVSVFSEGIPGKQNPQVVFCTLKNVDEVMKYHRLNIGLKLNIPRVPVCYCLLSHWACSFWQLAASGNVPARSRTDHVTLPYLVTGDPIHRNWP